MKKNFFLLVILVMALFGCKDNAEVRSAIGTYSYKTSGTLSVDALIGVNFIEQGAMDIVSLKDKDSVLVTFNELFGNVYSTHGSIKGNEITFNPFTRPLVNTKVLTPVNITVSGAGNIYDGSIVMSLQYVGFTKDSMMLVADDVQLIAKKNK